MASKGQKHICSKCKKPYYDLGKKEHSCPKCDGKLKTASLKKTNPKPAKEKEANDIKLAVELFTISSDKPHHAFTLANNKLEIELDARKFGWYAFPSEAVDGNSIPKKANVIYLNSPPLSGLETFLSSMKFQGIGPAISRKLVLDFGTDLFSILGSDAKSIQQQLKVNEATAVSLCTGWAEKHDENILSILLAELGFLEFQARKIRDVIGADFIPLINKNPFSLVKLVPQYSFEDVERLCRRLQTPITEKQKILAATEYCLHSSEVKKRNTCLPENYLYQEVEKLLSISVQKISEVTANAKEDFIYAERKNKKVISTKASHERDSKICRQLSEIIKRHKSIAPGQLFDSRNLETSEGISLSEEQISAINCVLNAPISVITGGPGSGKTTLVQGLVSALKTLKADLRLCAPTGRAAKRIAETPGLAEFSPSTIHKFITKQLASKSDDDFEVMIVDEASMIDADLMLELLEIMPAGASVVFIGDVDQLPPVGPGQPFKDIIESQTVSVSRLTGNFRQASFSDTVKAARGVIKGQMPILTNSLPESDFIFIECEAGAQAETVLNLYFDLMPAKLSIEPQDIQILSPQRPGEVGVFRLNELIQRRLTARSKALFQKKSGTQEVNFYVGDKVIQRKNNYELKVMNGDQGIITRLSGKDIMVEFNGEEVAYDGKQRFDLDLAYATTVHSSQGSEYPGVIVPIVSSHSHMLSRNLIYTAITRGKKQVCLVGQSEALERALSAYSKDFRWTCLSENLLASLS